MKKRLAFLLAASVASTALGQGVSAEFHGRWTVDGAATAARIAADSEMAEENKAMWTQRFTEGAESKIELIITESALEIPGFAEFPFGEILEASSVHVSVSSSLSDPRSGTQFDLVLDLVIQENGTLNMRLDSNGAFDDDDFDLVMWTRGEGGGATAASVSNDLVEYLDSLRECAPGEFRFSNTGLGEVKSTIVGPGSEGCQVTTETAGHEVVCNYSDETIALLTSEQKYEDARSGILQGSTDSEVSSRMSQECSLGGSR